MKTVFNLLYIHFWYSRLSLLPDSARPLANYLLRDMRRHVAFSVERLVGWVSQSTQIGTLECTNQSYGCIHAPACLRTFAAGGQKKPTQQHTTAMSSSSSSTATPSSFQQEVEPPPPPGMFAVISSMIAGAGGAVLVAGIGYASLLVYTI